MKLTKRARTGEKMQKSGTGNLPEDGVLARLCVVDLPQHSFPHGVMREVILREAGADRHEALATGLHPPCPPLVIHAVNVFENLR